VGVNELAQPTQEFLTLILFCGYPASNSACILAMNKVPIQEEIDAKVKSKSRLWVGLPHRKCAGSPTQNPRHRGHLRSSPKKSDFN